MTSKGPQYVLVSQYDVDGGQSFPSNPSADTDEYSSTLPTQPDRIPRAGTSAIRRWEWVTRAVLCLLTAVFFVFWITSASMRKCTYVIKYSPANEAIEYVEGKYKGALHTITPWRGDESGSPGSDIDAAWSRVSTDVKPIRATEEQLREMGMIVTPTTVKIPKEKGGGYLASLEVTHHLQCLDMLRKVTYREHYESFDPAFQIKDEILAQKLDTCVEILRQAIMCYPDTNMVTYYWVKGENVPFPNLNTIHRCKNFERILDWAALRAVDFPNTGR